MAGTPIDLAGKLSAHLADLAPGSSLPSVTDLSRTYEENAYTVRQALKILEGRGLVTGGQGRHWTVTRPALLEVYLERTVSRLFNGQRPAIAADAWVYAVRSTGHVAQESDPEVRIVPDGYQREMLRSIDGVPHNLARWIFPRWVAEGTKLAEPGPVHGGTIPYLEMLGHGPDSYTLRVRAGMPTPEEGQRLGLPRGGVPVLVETRTGRQGEREVFRSEVLWRGDQSELVVER